MTKNFLLAFSLLALAACGSPNPTAEGESVSIGDVQFSENATKDSSTIQSQSGTLTASEGAAAAATQFPAHAPQYPGSTVTGAIQSGGAGKPLKNLVNLTTNDSLLQIATFYRATFAEQGLTIGMNMLSEDALMLDAKSDSQSVGVLASIQDGKSNISLNFQSE